MSSEEKPRSCPSNPPVLSSSASYSCAQLLNTMSKKTAIPDAWDDDWESTADKDDVVAASKKVEEEVKISKAERLAKHAETNKKIWESA